MRKWYTRTTDLLQEILSDKKVLTIWEFMLLGAPVSEPSIKTAFEAKNQNIYLINKGSSAWNLIRA